MKTEYTDIQTGYLNMKLLRFTTAGSVDDGKSTLIGRLLYDSKAIFEDQMQALENTSMRRGEEGINLALLTDGLKAEREQGITIDVAYRYFATPKRKFIIADTPGHVQYTRNMVTGASTANVALILVDARNGVIEQTIRHSFIASLLCIPHIIICINKMDLVDYSAEVFEKIKNQFNDLIANMLKLKDVRFIPISALKGDNVVTDSENMDWYKGPTLINLLETIPIINDVNHVDARLPVQYVVRPQTKEHHDYRGYAGKIAGGEFRNGDKVVVLPSGIKTEIAGIDFGKEKVDRAFAPQSVTLLLKDDIDIGRGDMIVKEDNVPEVSSEITLMVCWLNEKPLMPNGKYIVRHTTKEVRCVIKEIKYKIDINTLQKNEKDLNVGLNEIACISIKTTQPLFYDAYTRNRITGSLVLIDEGTFNTVGACMIL